MKLVLFDIGNYKYQWLSIRGVSEAVIGNLINVKSKKKFLCFVEQLVHRILL